MQFLFVVYILWAQIPIFHCSTAIIIFEFALYLIKKTISKKKKKTISKEKTVPQLITTLPELSGSYCFFWLCVLLNSTHQPFLIELPNHKIYWAAITFKDHVGTEIYLTWRSFV